MPSKVDPPGAERRREVRRDVSIAVRVLAGGKTYLGEMLILGLQGAYIQLMDADPFPHEGNARLVPEGLDEPIDVAIRRKVEDEPGLVKGLGLEFLTVGPGARSFLLRALGQPED